MPRTWTKTQLDAITAKNKDILVSAAAGSGKTSVLIERILELIKSGASIERMLIVTFTKAAASEMRERLQRVLTNEAQTSPHIADQLEALPLARISTLHSFCNELISRHGKLLGIETRLNLLNELKNLSLTETAAERALNKLYDEPDADDEILIKNYNEEEIRAFLSELFDASREEIEPDKWLDSLTREIKNFEDEKALNAQLDFNYSLIMEEVEELISYGRELESQDGCPQKYSGLFDKYKELIASAEEGYKNRLLGLPFKLPTLPSVSSQKDNYDEIIKSRVSGLKTIIQEQVNQAFKLKPFGEKLKIELERINASLPERRALVKLCRNFSREYALLKQEKNAIDYNDMEKLAYQILKDEGARQETSELFDYIFVDEYQDISRLQEGLIQALRRDNSLFMVGDVKQSIYRFRRAEPRLFIEKFDSFSDKSTNKNRRISLNENFRSSKNILNAVNEVFSACMRKDVSEIEYDASARLNSPKSSELDAPVELNILTSGKGELNLCEDYTDVQRNNQGEAVPDEKPKDGDENEGNAQASNMSAEELLSCEREATLIAKRIIELCQNEYITEDGTKRKIEFRDIVILRRGLRSSAPVYTKVLLKYGIPLYSDKEARLYEIIEINDLICLLSFLDNPMLDEMLLASLSSPLFGYTADELAGVRADFGKNSCSFLEAFRSFAEQNDRAKKALEKLEGWRFEARKGSFQGFISKLLYEIGFYSLSGVLENSKLRRNNLRRFVDEIYKSDTDLHSFVSMARKLFEQKSEDAAPGISALDNVVRLTTIHKSKGLEFPVVFVTGLASRFQSEKFQKLLIDNDLGAALSSTEGRQRISSLLSRLILSKKQGERISEEARLLYVAMTRAKERLILIAKPASLSKFLDSISLPPCRNRIFSASSLLDFIGLALRKPLLELKETPQVFYRGEANWDIRLVDGININGRLNFNSSNVLTCSEDLFEIEPDMSIHLPQKIGISSLLSLTESHIEKQKSKLSEMDERILCLKSHGTAISDILLGFDKYKQEGALESTAHEDMPFEEVGLSEQASHEQLPAHTEENTKKSTEESKAEETDKNSAKDNADSEASGVIPAFELKKQQSSAKMGEALHKLFFFARLETLKSLNLSEKIAYFRALAKRLEEKQILSPKIVRQIDYSLPARFFETPLGQRMLASIEVYREKSFIYLSRDGVVLRGVVDVVFKEGSSYVLLDYKSDSDFDKPKPLHESQIGWYKQALSSLLEGGIKEAHVCYIRGPVSFEVE